MIKDIDFSPGHYDLFTPKVSKLNVSKDDLIAFASYGNTLVKTLIDTELKEVMCFVGMLEIRPLVVEVWLLPSILVNMYPKEFFKSIKRLIESVQKQFKLRRIQMTISETGLDKWAQKLGFGLEGVLSAYGPNREDERLYARVF